MTLNKQGRLMQILQTISKLLRRQDAPAAVFRTRIRGATVSVTFDHSPFGEALTQEFVIGLGNFLIQGLLTGEVPRIAQLTNAPSAKQPAPGVRGTTKR